MKALFCRCLNKRVEHDFFFNVKPILWNEPRNYRCVSPHSPFFPFARISNVNIAAAAAEAAVLHLLPILKLEKQSVHLIINVWNANEMNRYRLFVRWAPHICISHLYMCVHVCVRCGVCVYVNVRWACVLCMREYIVRVCVSLCVFVFAYAVCMNESAGILCWYGCRE